MRLNGFNIKSASLEIQYLQSFSRNQLKEWQNKKKWDILRFHYNNNPLYRSLVSNPLPNKWEDLPIMLKSTYQNELGQLLSKGFSKKNTFIANTSGSTGNPFFYAKDKEAHSMTWALALNRYKQHNIDLSSKQARFYGVPLERSSKIKEDLKDLILSRTRFSIFDLSENMLSKFIKDFQKNSFTYLYGYTNSMVLFARYLVKNKIVLKKICPSLTLCIATSENLTKEDKRIMSNGFGVRIINEYGVSEAGGIVAFEDVQNNWNLSIETQFIEIVDQNNNPVEIGERGNILLTDLHNKAMPFIRYKVGDEGKLKNIQGNLILEELSGRTNDLIRLPNGKTSPGLTFYYISRSILESSGVLKEFIIRQTKLNTFIFDIVSDRPLNKSEIMDIKENMNIYLQPKLNLKINRVKEIKRSKSGKLKHFFSELNV